MFYSPELLQKKDEQIVCLLEEKIHIFRELGDCSHLPEDTAALVRERMMFRATPDDITKGEPIIQDALREGEQECFMVQYCVSVRDEMFTLCPPVTSGDSAHFSQQWSRWSWM